MVTQLSVCLSVCLSVLFPSLTTNLFAALSRSDYPSDLVSADRAAAVTGSAVPQRAVHAGVARLQGAGSVAGFCTAH